MSNHPIHINRNFLIIIRSHYYFVAFLLFLPAASCRDALTRFDVVRIAELDFNEVTEPFANEVVITREHSFGHSSATDYSYSDVALYLLGKN